MRKILAEVRRNMSEERKGYQAVCYVMGYILAFYGWTILLIDFSETLSWAGYLFVPSWLLLRLAAGLFPFGSQFFKWQKTSAADRGCGKLKTLRL